jgi:ADP-heptose:LPS heptosyltransferase
VRWTPRPEEASAASARLSALPALRVGLQVGSHAVATGLFGPRRRRDPSDAWLVATARALHERLGAGLVVHGGTGGPERRAARRLVAALAGLPVVLVEGLDVEALGATLAGLSAFVSANTGPLHLAAAAGTPVVLLDGPSTPLAHPWRAAGGSRVLSLGLPCSPCRGTEHGRACPAPRCLDDLPAERVVDAVRALV